MIHTLISRISLTVLYVVTLGMASCNSQRALTLPIRSDEEQQVVMTEGEEIKATTQEGTLTIQAGKNYERSFEWNGAVRSARMIPRPAPWYGHLGIYNPGQSGMWRKHDGVTRVVYAEYQLSFPTKAEAETYLASWYSSNTLHYNSDSDIKPAGVWNDDGLVVWWKRSRWAQAMNVTVLQVLIDGKRPIELKGSQDANLTVKSGAAPSNDTQK
jgi:hypothetical protein